AAAERQFVGPSARPGPVPFRCEPPYLCCMHSKTFTLRVADGMNAVPAAQWSRLAGTSRNRGAYFNPFLRHEFLLALEESGSATARTGWSPAHLLLEDGSGELAGAAPCYLKSHSQGEYVFDHGWAHAFER